MTNILEKYRIFTDGLDFVYVATKMEDGKITVLAQTDNYSTALGVIIHDAGLSIPLLTRPMNLSVFADIYKPVSSDWANADYIVETSS